MARQSPSSKPAAATPVVEGLSGRLPVLVGGLLFVFALIILFRLRSVLHAAADVIDFDTIGTWGSATLLVIFVFVPLLHTLSHALAMAGLKIPQRLIRRLIYPRFRPRQPVSRQQATWILAAPLVVSLLLLLLLAVRSLSAFVAVWSAVNLGLSSNDIWKILGLRRFPRSAQVEMNLDHCRIVE